MPTSRSELQGQIDDLEETLQQVSDLADEALDPELSREQLVAKLKEIADAVASDDEEPEEEEQQD